MADSDSDGIIGSGGAPLADEDVIVAGGMPKAKRRRTASALAFTCFSLLSCAQLLILVLMLLLCPLAHN